MKYLKREKWGYKIILNGEQVGAGVGIDPVGFYGFGLKQKKMWRKYGFAIL